MPNQFFSKQQPLQNGKPRGGKQPPLSHLDPLNPSKHSMVHPFLPFFIYLY